MIGAARVSGSFRDPAGFVFSRNGIVYRQISSAYLPHYDKLKSSGLYQRLVDEGLLIPHQDMGVSLRFTELAALVIRPTQLQFVSHPFEWSFTQLKDFARATLRIQQQALEHGMTLKDASAYNIQLHESRPTWIDTLSFSVYESGQPWVAYRQFCQHFLAPLALMSCTDIRLGQLSRVHLDGVPLDLASRLLPFRSRFSLGLGLHLHAHAKMQRRYEDRAIPATIRSRGMSLPAQQRLIAHLLRTVDGMKSATRKSEWAGYYDSNNNYGSQGLAAKKRLLRGFLGRQPAQVVWDLGANNGSFSRLALECGARTVVAWDIDPNCVDENYQQVVARRERGHFPLLLDLTNPSPSIGWANRERLSISERGPADMVLMLGLIHHLAISHNLPLTHIVSYVSSLARHSVIEWVPKEDSQVQKLLSTRPDIFQDYEQSAFELVLGQHFRILRRESVESTCRTLYLLEAIHG